MDSIVNGTEFLLRGLIVIGVGSLLIAALGLAVIALCWVGHAVIDMVFGECESCSAKRHIREGDERRRVAEAERIIREHDRSEKTWQERHS